MNRTIEPAPVRRSVTVKASQRRAFEAFTGAIGNWWPRTHHIGATDPKAITIEPREGGRWFETGQDGAECEWGRVLVWEPPSRLVLAWQVDADFKYDPGLVTEVELSFTALAERETRVDLEHRNLDRFGQRGEEVRSKIGAPGGWTAVLESYASTVS